MPPLSRTVRAAGASLALASAALAADATTGLPKNSPFMPAAAESSAPQATDRIEFAGVSAVGKKVDVIFFDKGAKKNIWVGVGETKDGISVVSYDERRDQVTVKFDGNQKILSLRKVSKAGNAPGRSVTPLPAPAGFNVPAPLPTVLPAAAPVTTTPTTSSAPADAASVSAPATPPPPATPEAQATAKAETEARMLVSDLLEIGMAQRRAYEDAQRRAADPNAAKNAPAQPPVPGTP